MSVISIKAFGGMRPLLSEYLLDAAEATLARNVKLLSGAIEPLKALTTLQALKVSNPKTIWRYGNSSTEGQYWFEFAGDVDIIRSPIEDDPHGRAYWTDGVQPKYGPNSLLLSGTSGYPGGSYNLGVPKPAAKIAFSGATYGKALDHIDPTTIASLVVGDVLAISVNGGSDVTITLTDPGGGAVTAASLAAQINPLAGIDASVQDDGSVKVSTTLATATSKFSVRKKTGTSESYAEADVTYTDVVPTVNGTETTPASATYTTAMIDALVPNNRLEVKINNNAPVVVVATAGTGTFPADVTATSLKTSLSSVPGLVVELTDGVSQYLVLKTVLTGTSASLRVRKVNPKVVNTYVEIAADDNTTATQASEMETRAYCYTYVSAYGEEGPPSDASDLATVNPDLSTQLSNMSTGPSGAYNITMKRIYRSSTVGSTASWQFVAEIPVANTTYTDSKSQDELGEVLPTEGWVPPPATLKGLKMSASGFAVGFTGNVVHLSEPNLPHAWPHKYAIDLPIVGVGVFRQGVAVLTNGHPYLLTGVDPGAMSLERLELPLACLSPQSIVDTGDGVAYASGEGLVSLSTSGNTVVTSKILSKEQWAFYNPSTMRVAWLDGRFFIFYTATDASNGVLIIDVANKGAPMVLSDIGSANAVSAAYVDPRTSTLYLATEGQIRRWDNSSTALTATWRSKVFRTEVEQVMGAAAVDADGYPVTLNVYANGSLWHTRVVANSDPFRLPVGPRSKTWQIELVTNKRVTRVRMATTMRELKGVS